MMYNVREIMSLMKMLTIFTSQKLIITVISYALLNKQTQKDVPTQNHNHKLKHAQSYTNERYTFALSPPTRYSIL